LIPRWAVFLIALPLAARIVPDRYIVELEGEPAVTLNARGGKGRAMASDRAAVQASQRAAMTRVRSLNVDVIDSVDTVANALIVQASETDAQQLASLPGVRKVHRVWEGKALLDRALPIHRVPDAWTALGVEDTGAGIRIGIIDSGLDPRHSSFAGGALQMPAGYPLPVDGTREGFEGNKVVVARSYDRLYGMPDSGAGDRNGHGTGVAMAAAGSLSAGPLASISGVAPNAYLGVYRVMRGGTDSFTLDVVLKAIDDAVADGMHIINLSLGLAVPLRQAADPIFDAVERASAAGVIVVAAAGNDGPLPMSVGPPATAPSVISVGAIPNDRIFATALETSDGSRFTTFPPTGNWPESSVSGSLVDITTVDPSGLACNAVPPDALSGKIVLILRGTCLFEEKLNAAQAAGAVAAIVYTHADSPELMRMSVGGATLPAQSLSHADGLALKALIAADAELTAILKPGPNSIPVDSQVVWISSSRGPNPDNAIKPDLLAVGAEVYTAAQRADADGELYNASGYDVHDGTSFAAPIVAGAAAVLKAARPGLTNDQYRSLLINSSTAVFSGGFEAPMQHAGAGALDLEAAMRSTITAQPTSVSFGVTSGTVQGVRVLTIQNIGGAEETYTVSAIPRRGGVAPMVAMPTVRLAAGATESIHIAFTAADLAAGAYDGHIVIQGTRSATRTRVPYWLGIGPGDPALIRIVYSEEEGRAGGTVRDAVLFQVLDANGIPVTSVEPVITAIRGDGTSRTIFSIDDEVPGGYVANVQLGPEPGANIFRIEVGELAATFTIQGEAP
jgi:hypothetical protein